MSGDVIRWLKYTTGRHYKNSTYHAKADQLLVPHLTRIHPMLMTNWILESFFGDLWSKLSEKYIQGFYDCAYLGLMNKYIGTKICEIFSHILVKLT